VKIELFVIRRLTMSVDKDSFGGAGDYLDNWHLQADSGRMTWIVRRNNNDSLQFNVSCESEAKYCMRSLLRS